MSTTSCEKVILTLEIEYDVLNLPSTGLFTEEFMRRVIPHEVALTTQSPIINAPVKRGGVRLQKLKVKRVQTINSNIDVSK